MAVYTKLNEINIKEVLSNYSIGSLNNFKGIQEGIENTNYFIQAEKGKFILTLYEKRVEEKDLPFFISLMKNLFDKKFPSPEPIINKNGNYISEISEKKAAGAGSVFLSEYRSLYDTLYHLLYIHIYIYICYLYIDYC